MVKANESGLYPQHSAWPPSKLNFMSTALQPRQQECLPAGISPGSCVPSARLALPRFEVPGIPDLKTEQTKDAYASLQCLPLHFQSLFPTPNPYLKGRQSLLSHGLDGNAGPNTSSGSSPKRFLIFDQCGNQTRLIHNSVSLPVWSPATATTKPFFGYKSNEEEQAARVSPTDPRKYFLHEESGENKIASEESEMHEDTEEINALLYSDESDGDDDYGDDDDDEVASTGHSPMAIKGSYEKHEHVECIGEEVAGSDGPNKRPKLLDGGYKKSSPMETASSVKLDRSLAYDSDAESSYAIGQNQGEEASSILGKRPFKRGNIRDALRILESIIPGAEGKDPLLVIDEAIDYLKSMRHKAKSLGVSHQ
jgi:hypothetical protein